VFEDGMRALNSDLIKNFIGKSFDRNKAITIFKQKGSHVKAHLHFQNLQLSHW